MACNLKRIADLPIQEELKIRLLEFFQKPENLQACERLNQASDEQLVAMIQNIAERLQGAQGAEQNAQPPGPQGIASMQQPTRSQTPPGVPPGQLADIPKPMDKPLGIAQVPPRRY